MFDSLIKDMTIQRLSEFQTLFQSLYDRLKESHPQDTEPILTLKDLVLLCSLGKELTSSTIGGIVVAIAALGSVSPFYLQELVRHLTKVVLDAPIPEEGGEEKVIN